MKKEIKALKDKAMKLDRKAGRYAESITEIRTDELEKLEGMEEEAEKAFKVYLTAYYARLDNDNADRYQIYMSGLGLVWAGKYRQDALQNFSDYRSLSFDGYAHFARKSVTLLEDGQCIKDFRI